MLILQQLVLQNAEEEHNTSAQYRTMPRLKHIHLMVQKSILAEVVGIVLTY
jgi:hypothetical protein